MIYCDHLLHEFSLIMWYRKWHFRFVNISNLFCFSFTSIRYRRLTFRWSYQSSKWSNCVDNRTCIVIVNQRLYYGNSTSTICHSIPQDCQSTSEANLQDQTCGRGIFSDAGNVQFMPLLREELWKGNVERLQTFVFCL